MKSKKIQIKNSAKKTAKATPEQKIEIKNLVDKIKHNSLMQYKFQSGLLFSVLLQIAFTFLFAPPRFITDVADDFYDSGYSPAIFFNDSFKILRALLFLLLLKITFVGICRPIVKKMGLIYTGNEILEKLDFYTLEEAEKTIFLLKKQVNEKSFVDIFPVVLMLGMNAICYHHITGLPEGEEQIRSLQVLGMGMTSQFQIDYRFADGVNFFWNWYKRRKNLSIYSQREGQLKTLLERFFLSEIISTSKIFRTDTQVAIAISLFEKSLSTIKLVLDNNTVALPTNYFFNELQFFAIHYGLTLLETSYSTLIVAMDENFNKNSLESCIMASIASSMTLLEIEEKNRMVSKQLRSTLDVISKKNEKIKTQIMREEADWKQYFFISSLSHQSITELNLFVEKLKKLFGVDAVSINGDRLIICSNTPCNEEIFAHELQAFREDIKNIIQQKEIKITVEEKDEVIKNNRKEEVAFENIIPMRSEPKKNPPVHAKKDFQIIIPFFAEKNYQVRIDSAIIEAFRSNEVLRSLYSSSNLSLRDDNLPSVLQIIKRGHVKIPTKKSKSQASGLFLNGQKKMYKRVDGTYAPLFLKAKDTHNVRLYGERRVLPNKENIVVFNGMSVKRHKGASIDSGERMTDTLDSIQYRKSK